MKPLKVIMTEILTKFNGLEVTEIFINLVHLENSKLLAFASITFNELFMIKSIKIIKGQFGNFISFPSEYNKKEEKGYNICFPIEQDFKEHLSRMILEKYHEEFNKDLGI